LCLLKLHPLERISMGKCLFLEKFLMKQPKRYTVTAALPYTNGPLHIGHLAGVYVPADIYTRYLRLQGREVAFICGSDEHGVAIAIKAKKEGKSPQEVIDQYDALIRESFEEFGIAFDNYSRTSRQVHYETAQEIFKTLLEKDVFVKKNSEQLYDEEAQQFLADRFVTGTCPICQHPEAYGDQCESCGSALSPTELKNPISTLSGSAPKLRKTTHWYLPLDRYETFIREWILEGHQKDWKPNVYGQVKSWVDNGLAPRAVTRDLDWGIPVPVPDGKGKVLYVWFDAPIGYISSTKEWAAREGKDWKPFWQDPDTQLVHFIGKDNIVFHCIIFPVVLKAHGTYILPQNVPANEFLNLEGQKISTSKNWAVWLHEYLNDFPGKQDVLRYVLAANAPETKDNDFTWSEFQAKNNNELVAIYGNFINRVLVLTQKYYNGKVPKPQNLNGEEEATLAQLANFPDKIGQAIEHYKFREACQEMMQLARLGNKFLADAEPWKLIKENPERVENIMYVALQIATALAVLSEPILPFTAKKLQGLLQIEGHFSWASITQKKQLPAGHQLRQPTLLFEKIEKEAIDAQLEKLTASSTKISQKMPSEPPKELITFDQFTALDLQIVTIKAAIKVPKTDKLLQITIDVGGKETTVVSGIAASYEPDEIIGKQVLYLANLAPRKIRGVESQGMLLLGEASDGKLVFVSPVSPLAPGTKVS